MTSNASRAYGPILDALHDLIAIMRSQRRHGLMRLGPVLILSAGVILAATASPACCESTDAFIVLTTVGYLTGAADACRVAPVDSNALASGLAIAIERGKYGNAAEAHTTFNTARQRGIADATAGSVDCHKVGDRVRAYVRAAGADAPRR